MKQPTFTPDDLRAEPLERAETIPAHWYTDPAFFAWDQAQVLAQHWQLVGHMQQIPNEGDFLTARVAGNPVLVIRDQGELRAFYNVCRHRGGPLATTDFGQAKMLQCQYHGWTYRRDGSLRGVPRFDRVELFDRKDYGLLPLSLACWEGLIFLHLQEDPPSLAEAVSGIAERIHPIRLADKKFYQRVRYTVACNWKVYMDNYLEGYHLPYVHPELCTLLDVGRYETEAFPHYVLQSSPLRPEENVYTALDGSGENPVAFYYCVFPNLMLNILPGRLQTNIVNPLGPDCTEVIFDYFYDEVTTPTAQTAAKADVAYSDQVQEEDMDICAHVQIGLQSRAYDRGRFSVECENGVHQFQTWLKAQYRHATTTKREQGTAQTADLD